MNTLKLLFASALLAATTFSGSAAAQETTVAVIEFRNEDRAGWWQGANGWATADMLISELASTESFRLVDRLQIESVMEEQKIRASGKVAPRQAMRIGKLVGAKYVVVGAVTDYEQGVSKEETKVNFGPLGFGGAKAHAYVAVDLRVINVATGEVAYARSIEGRIKGGKSLITFQKPGVVVSSGNEDKTPVGKAIRAALQEGAEYLECVMVKKTSRCFRKYGAREEQRRASGEKALDRD